MTRRKKGFSLVEILVVVTLLGILSAFCIPIFSQHLTHVRRIEAEMTLSKLAVAMENYYTAHDTYENATLEVLGFNQNIAGGRYQLDIRLANATRFELEAIPVGKQAERDSRCATLLLNSQGEKNITGTGSQADCWQNS
jgi:type IV pilus assembly protein PilE